MALRLSRRCQFLVECLNLPKASGVEDARWEAFQLEMLNDEGPFRIDLKARQIAYSFALAAGAVADAVLSGSSSTAFISINKEEAKEKIRYAKAVYENLEVSGLPKIVRDNDMGLEFSNGERILSLPGRPPRGKARFNLGIDEFAHIQRDRAIYQAALPIISKGGRLRIGSSPLGASGVFWEVYAQRLQKYPGYIRRKTPWWLTYAFCRNPQEARKMAPGMDSFSRVDLFGNDRIKAIFANMLLEDFQQEYECAFVDESTAWITWEEILKNQKIFRDSGLKYWVGDGPDKVSDIIIKVLGAIARGQCEPVLVGGIDVGRKHDATEFIALGVSPSGRLPVRFNLTLSRVEFDLQKEALMQLITMLPFSRVLIDRNGIGAQLAEDLQATGRAEGIDFTGPNKELWAVESRLQFQRGNVPLPPIRDLSYQIHSIKKTRTAAKNSVYDTERNEKHHADKFWALALGIWAHTAPGDGWIAYAKQQQQKLAAPAAA